VTSQIVITEYAYNDSGLRVTETTTTDGGTPVVKSFLFDPSNPTGYAQVLEEYIDGALSKTFTLGHDVISQHDTSGGGVLTLLTDGHGSTRALLNTLGVIIEQYAYEAYGTMLEGANLTTAQAALTSLLYSGEWTQANGQQYLRARFYDPATGTFNRLDPFAGNNTDPQSLHKYLYTHGNPVMGIDPSGLFTMSELLVSVTNISSRFAQVANNLNKARAFASRINTIIDIISTLAGGGITAVVQSEIKRVGSEWLTNQISGLSTTSRLFRQQFWEDAALSLASNAARIATEVFSTHAALIAKRSRQRDYRLAIFMPTPTGDTPLDLLIPNPGGYVALPNNIEMLGKPVTLIFGKDAFRGRLFGLGFTRDNGTSDLLFRMDYHDLHGKEDWDDTSHTFDFGFHIQGQNRTNYGRV